MKDGAAGVDADDYPGARGSLAAAAERGRRRWRNNGDDGERAVRGPLKNFRAGSMSASRSRIGRKNRRRGEGNESDFSGEGSSADDSEGSKVGVVFAWKGGHVL